MARFWKPVEVKMEMADEVLPCGDGTAGRRRGARRVRVEAGMAVKLWSGRGRDGVDGAL